MSSSAVPKSAVAHKKPGKKPRPPGHVKVYKTAGFKIHNPSARKRAMLKDSLERVHHFYTRLLVHLLPDVERFASMNEKELTMSLPNTALKARALGLTRYYTGKPCKHGHIAERYASSEMCTVCDTIKQRAWRKVPANRAKKNARNNEYQKANRAGANMRQRRYVERDPERHRTRQKNWRAEHPEAMPKYRKKWVVTNPEKKRESDKRYAETNVETLRAKCAKWSKDNRAKRNASESRRRAAKLRATPRWLTQEQHDEMALIYESAVRCEQLTGVKYHVDHWQPLQGRDRRGLHVPGNLQAIPAHENFVKSNGAPEKIRSAAGDATQSSSPRKCAQK